MSLPGKRAATTDIAEASDRKRAAREEISEESSSTTSMEIRESTMQDRGQSEPHSGRRRTGTSEPGGILLSMASKYSSPFPVNDYVTVTVTFTNYDDFFGDVWDSLVNVIYPDANYDETGLITRDNWVKVCEYLLKGRVDTVYSNTMGRRVDHRIAVSKDFEVPKCVADVINGVGVITVNAGALMIVPKPQGAPEDQSRRVGVGIGWAELASFQRLVQAAFKRGFIRVSTIGTASPGTAYWLLTARKANATAEIAKKDSVVKVFGVFKEWTLSDGCLAAIVQNSYDGLFGGITQLMWSMEAVNDVVGMRASFILEA